MRTTGKSRNGVDKAGGKALGPGVDPGAPGELARPRCSCGGHVCLQSAQSHTQEAPGEAGAGFPFWGSVRAAP